MSSIQSLTAWKRLNGELLASTDRDFERAALPLLRAFWPSMIQPKGLSAYDKAGIDLIAFDHESRIICAVQCKGFFKAEGLQDDQLYQINKSIDSFRMSNIKSDCFVILHNQDGRNVGLAQSIDKELSLLVKQGQVKRVIQWSRTDFLQELSKQIRAMISERVREQSGLMIKQVGYEFSLGRPYIAKVPVTLKTLKMKRGRPAEIRSLGTGTRDLRIADAIGGARGRWTLVTGLFGSGKTSAALNAAHSHPHRILYVHAASIEPTGGDGGTNKMMERILDALSVFGDFDNDERAIFQKIGAPLLRKLLSNSDTDTILVLDALDENRGLFTPQSITKFASTLSELRCPIIMTTRDEHFRATFGNFEQMFDELSTKGGDSGKIRVLGLAPWGKRQVLSLIASAAAADIENINLARLRRDVESDRVCGWDRELLNHPIFLRMIIELVADGQHPLIGRAATIDNWIWQKLSRDLKSDRPTPVQVEDRNEFIEKINLVMMEAAAAMVTDDESVVSLLDSVSSDKIVQIYQRILKVDHLTLSSALAVSLLVPTVVRYRGTVPIRFTHRIFQEFYLARYLLQNGRSVDGYPDSVKGLFAELSMQ